MPARCPALLVLPALLAAPAAAQSPPATELDTVQVQVERYDARRDDGATRIVFDAGALRQYGDTALLDALKRLPGVSVVAGAPGRPGGVTLRGLGNGYTQILINGQKAPLGFDLDSLTPEMVEKVEILRAPTADLRGEAIAGTLNIVLVSGAERDSDTVTANWSVNNGRSTPSVSWQRSRRSEGRSHTITTTATRRAFLVEEASTETVNDATGQPTALRQSALRASGTREALVVTPSLELTFDNADTLALQAYIDASRFQRHIDIDWDTQLGEPLLHTQYQQQTTIDLIQANGSAEWTHALDTGGSFSSKLALGGNHERYRYREQGQDTQGQQNLDDHTDARLNVRNANSTGKWALPSRGRHTLQLGWEASLDHRDEERLQQLRPISGLPGSISDLSFDAEVGRLAVYAQDDIELSPRWSLYLGTRWEHISTRSSGSGFDPVRQTDSVLSPILQSRWKLPGTGDRQLRLALTRTYKSPTLGSLIPRPYTSTNNRPLNPDEQGNPALKPELATGVDLAYEAQRKNGVQWSIGGYARRIRDVVLTDTTLRNGRWVATPRNGGSARSWGVEMDAKAPLHALIANAPDITLRANATYNASRVDEVPGPDNRLDGQLRFTGSVGADYRIDPRWNTGASYTWRSGDPTRVSTWQTDLEGWNRELDVYVVRAFGPRNKLRLSVGNLLHPDTRSGQRLQDENGTQVLQRERRITPTWRLQWELAL
ncbi:TonB-dependent receptor plug domain-containing protein [Stenotrophomonas oahuensis]|uniref:TonB-dependent receptor n=1 Tax=Stenotrophomonas oahuensis TaxID=3003271 RepID=A0ABY9YL35_9GAMM|nr:TonB-dependent receptor [Stenotrophomonas sp. A5586]WNH51375.1 TonB-dependent receptor [Stenotrophomonas sp. A5586]